MMNTMPKFCVKNYTYQISEHSPALSRRTSESGTETESEKIFQSLLSVSAQIPDWSLEREWLVLQSATTAHDLRQHQPTYDDQLF